MASILETGHAKNVANFDDLISFIPGYGTAYNPSKVSICLAELQTLSALAKKAIESVNAALPAYSNAVAAREVAFVPLNKLCTRVINALKATDTSKSVVDNARTLVRKIQGIRASKKQTEEQKKSLLEQGIKVVEISSSQMSYDNRLDNLDKLIKLLSSVELYTPNEADLKISSLIVLYNDLKTKNRAVVNAAAPLSNARILRNDILYKDHTGLVDIALDTKSYIKSIYGATNPMYKQISGLAFKHVKA